MISGQVENHLPVNVANVKVRCSMPNALDPGAQHWEVTLANLAANDRTKFVFAFDASKVAAYGTFAIQLWGIGTIHGRSEKR